MVKINLKRKFTFGIILLLCFFMFIGGYIFADENNDSIQGEGIVQNIDSIIDIKNITGEYKVSNESSDISLPFFRNSLGRMEIDKPINKFGFIFSASTIDINEELKNIQFFLSQDAIRVNANMEYAFIWSGGDVVINSDVKRNAVIFSGGTVTIGENVNIGDDLIVIANSVNIKGKVNASAIISAQNINVSGEIKNDLRCNVYNIEVSSDNNVKGNLYVTSYNKDINSIKDKYKEATVKIKEEVSKAKSFGDILIKSIISCLMYTLIYLIVRKLSKKKAHKKMLDKITNNTLFVVLSGSVFLLAFPAMFVFLLILSLLGLYILALPILITYVAFLIIFVLLSIYVVGSAMFEYMNSKYIKSEKLYIELIGVFCTYLSLTLITKIPVVGTYMYMAMIIISIGIMIAFFLKKDKEDNKSKEK